MDIGSLFLGLWIGFLSLFGSFAHQDTVTPQPDLGAVSSSTAAAQTAAQQTPVTSQAPSPNIASKTTSESVTANTQATTNAAPLPSGSAWLSSVPLGDNKYTTSGAKEGYIYVCHIAQGGGGAQGEPTWISGNVWYPNEKIAVQGSVRWPNATYSMTISGSERVIKGNGLPTDHDTGTFPIQSSDPAYQIDRNPNSVQTQNYDFQLPADPTMRATPDCIYGQVGIMNDGVKLFDGFDAEYRDAVAHETQDQWEGHPDETGVYHDHGFESGPVKDPVSTVVGFAFDGYPITGSALPNGNYLHTSDLDECHGITSTITLDGSSVTMYHYVLTQDFPYSVSCFRGTSYEPKPGGGGGQSSSTNTQGTLGQGQQGGPPQAAITACASHASGSSCSFSTPNGTVAGACQTPPGQSSLACVPNR